MSRVRSKRYREKLKADPNKKSAYAAKAKLRVLKSCALKRKLLNQSQRPSSSFKNVQQKGKVLKKVLKALPTSMEKQSEILSILSNSSACKDNSGLSPACSKLYGLSESDVLVVVSFYNEDEVFQISPNKKDFT